MSIVTIDSSILLKRLAPTTAGGDRSVGRKRSVGEFDSLLQLVSSGEPVGEPVRGDAQDLDEFQRRRLTAALDLALARGFDRIVVVIDRRSFVLDVAERAIEREFVPVRNAELEEVQAVIHAADPSSVPVRPLGPPSGLPPAVVQRSLHRSSGL